MRSLVVALLCLSCSSSSKNDDGLFGGGSGFAGQSTGGVAGAEIGGAAGTIGGAAGEWPGTGGAAGSPSGGQAGAVADAATCTLPEQTPGDCVVAVCDGPSAVLVSDFADVPADDGDACTDDVCTTGGVYGLAKASHPQKAAGSPCGAGLVCDASGACI